MPSRSLRYFYTVVVLLWFVCDVVRGGPIHTGTQPTTTEFLPPQHGKQVTPSYAQLHGKTAQQCEAACAFDPKCIVFSYMQAQSTCALSTWDPRFVFVDAKSPATYCQQKAPSAPSRTSVTPNITYTMAPVVTGLTIDNASIFGDLFKANLRYLEQFSVDDMVYWFRERAGLPQPPHAQSWGWDNGARVHVCHRASQRVSRAIVFLMPFASWRHTVSHWCCSRAPCCRGSRQTVRPSWECRRSVPHGCRRRTEVHAE